MRAFRWAMLVTLAAVVLFIVPVAIAGREGGEVQREKVQHLLREAEELEEMGRIEDARSLRREAERLQERGGAIVLHREREERAEQAGRLKKRIHMFMGMAEILEREDTPELAEALRHRAEMLERQLHQIVEAKEQRRPPHVEKPRGRAEELHRHAKELRAQAEKLAHAGKEAQARELMERAERLQGEAAKLGRPREMPAELRELVHRQERLQNAVRELGEQVRDLREEVQGLRALLRKERR